MNSSRNINPSILVAALSACIGLLTVGAPARAQEVSASLKFDGTASQEVEVPNDGTPRRTGSSSRNKRLRALAGEAAEKIAQFLGSEKQLDHFDSGWKNPVHRSAITFLLENSALVVSSKTQFAIPYVAQKEPATLEAYFSFRRCRDHGTSDGVLFENSKPIVENSQFLIVTHLPRAALADLLAKPFEVVEQDDETASKA